MERKNRFVIWPVAGVVVLAMGIFIFAQQSGGDQKNSDQTAASDRGAGNPVKLTPQSIEAGKKLFSEKCDVCHGEKGDGNGDMAEMLHPKPADLTNPDGVGKRSDKQIFDLLTNGKDVMPKFKDLPEKDRWNLVNFIRSLEAKSAASSRDPVKKN